MYRVLKKSLALLLCLALLLPVLPGTHSASADQAAASAKIERLERVQPASFMDKPGIRIVPKEAAALIATMKIDNIEQYKVDDKRYVSYGKYAIDGDTVTINQEPRPDSTVEFLAVDGTSLGAFVFDGTAYRPAGTKRQVTVTFVTNGAKETIDPRQIDAGSTLEAPAVTKDGYTLDGWYKDEAFRMPFDFKTPIQGPLTLYARWLSDTATITALSPEEGVFGGNQRYGFAIEPKDLAEDLAILEIQGTVYNRSPYGAAGLQAGEYYRELKDNDSKQDRYFKVWLAAKPAQGSTVVLKNKVGRVLGSFTFDGTNYTNQAAPQTYTVHFEMNGYGAPVPDQQVPANGKAAIPPKPTAAGHSFLGWFVDKALHDPFDFDTPINKDVTVYAKWIQVTKYVVTFDLDGDTEKVEAQIIEPGKYAKRPKDPTKADHQFLGWFRDKEGQSEFSFADTPIEGDITLYGKWKATTAMLTFETNGGESLPKKKVQIDSSLDNLPTPTWQGHKFLGWFTDKGFSSPADGSVRVRGDMTLYAKWQEEQVTLTIDEQNGKPAKTQQVAKDSSIDAPPAPTRANHRFEGWTLDAAGKKAATFPLKMTQSTTLYAQWTKEKVRVSYHFNNNTPNTNESVDKGSSITAPAAPTYEGHTFAGWYTDETLTQKAIFPMTVNADLTFYAKWTENKPTPKTYTVHFEMNGGAAIADQNVEDGKTASEPAKPTRKGYTFGGWYADQALKTAYDFKAPIKANTTIYAKWTAEAPKTYTVHFEMNGAEAIVDQKVEDGKTASEPAKPTRKGYTFGGWYADQALETAYDFKAPIKADTTIYAKWTAEAKPSRRHRGSGSRSGGWGVAPSVKKEEAGKGKTKIVFRIGDNTISETTDKTTDKRSMDAKVFIEAGRARIPVRFAAQSLGIKVDWQQATKTVLLSKDDRRVEVPVDADFILIDGKKVAFDNIAILRDGRVYLTPRALVKALELSKDIHVDWDAVAQTVTIHGVV